MQGIQGHNHDLWYPLISWGYKHAFFTVHLDTIYTTWIIIGFLVTVMIGLRPFLVRHDSVVFYAVESYLDIFKDMVVQSVGYFVSAHFTFIAALFSFILLCNWSAFIPGLEEPTADLNTTLALGCIAFFYKEYWTIKVHGIKGYIQEFLQPFFVMLPLNIISHFSKVVSLSFRLFGNIFGGSIITKLWSSLLSNSLILNILGIVPSIIICSFFIFFEGLIQAFVFSMLTITYLGMAVQHEE